MPKWFKKIVGHMKGWFKMTDATKNQKVVIPINEDDIEMFKDLVYCSNNRFSWTFPSDKGENIDIHFTDEYCEGCMDTDGLELCPVENILYCKECLDEENE